MTTNSITFPSLMQGDKYGYELHSDGMKYYDQMRRSGKCFWVNSHAGWFETYGDGLVKHSPDIAVPNTQLGDYCLSLANYLLTRPEFQPFAVRCLQDCVPSTDKWPQMVRFFADLRYDERKPFRYFSVDWDSFCKVSAAESKRHDKRWQPIPSNADGSAEFIWGQIINRYGDATNGAFVCYCYRLQFMELCREADVYVSQYPRDYLNLADRNVDGPVRALQAVIQGAQLLKYAQQTTENILASLERDRELAVA
jgi:hypothetical protein